MPSARRVHSFTSSPAHFTFEVGGVHTIFPGCRVVVVQRATERERRRMTADGAIDPVRSLTTGRRAARTMCIKSGVLWQSEDSSLRLPYAPKRHGEYSIAKADTCSAIVEHYSRSEPLTSGFSEFS